MEPVVMANIKLKDENQMLKDEMETLKNELKKAKTRIKVFENEIMTVIGQKDDLQQKYDKLRSESDELEKAQNQTIAKLRHELKTEKAKLKITENNQQKFSKELQTKLEEKDSVIIQKELALGDLSSQISILKSELEWPDHAIMLDHSKFLKRHLETKLSNEIKRRRDIPQQDMLKQENEDLKEKLMAIFKLNREQLVDFEKTVNGMRKEFSHKAWAK